jgi:hypothetical protein
MRIKITPRKRIKEKNLLRISSRIVFCAIVNMDFFNEEMKGFLLA